MRELESYYRSFEEDLIITGRIDLLSFGTCFSESSEKSENKIFHIIHSKHTFRVKFQNTTIS